MPLTDDNYEAEQWMRENRDAREGLRQRNTDELGCIGCFGLVFIILGIIIGSLLKSRGWI